MTGVTRRGLLQAALTGGLAVRLPTTTPAESADTQYLGPWTLTWGGWQAHGSDVLSGFWTAVHVRTQKRVYSTVGGVIQAYRAGDQFDICYTGGRTALTQDLPPPILRAERQAALDRLRKALGSPP